jgi:hypothetical protein
MPRRIGAEPEQVVQIGFLLRSRAQGSTIGLADGRIPTRFYAPHSMSVIIRTKRNHGHSPIFMLRRKYSMSTEFND